MLLVLLQWNVKNMVLFKHHYASLHEDKARGLNGNRAATQSSLLGCLSRDFVPEYADTAMRFLTCKWIQWTAWKVSGAHLTRQRSEHLHPIVQRCPPRAGDESPTVYSVAGSASIHRREHPCHARGHALL
jgi:hypothetical protein